MAKAANNGLNPPLVAEWRNFQTQLQWDLQRRKMHYEMLGKLHQCQTKLAEQRESSTHGMQLFMGKLGRSVFDVMASYEPGNFFYKDVHWEAGVNFDMECTSEFAAEVLQFWNDIQWSHETTDEVGLQGISWSEITLAFLLDRNMSIPTKIPRTQQLTFKLSDVRAGGWGFFHVAKSFFWAVQSINRSLGGKLFVNLKRGKVRSLQKLGSTNQVNGFIHRPRVPQQEQMVRVLESYFKAHGRYAGLHTWPVINVANLEDESFWAGLKIAEQ